MATVNAATGVVEHSASAAEQDEATEAPSTEAQEATETPSEAPAEATEAPEAQETPASEGVKKRRGSFSSSSSEEGDDEEDDGYQPVLPVLDDHFSLPVSSCVVRSRKKANVVRVYDPGFGQQIVIEEHRDKNKKTLIEVKKMDDVTTGHQLLNGFYALVTALFAGFLFVFCLQVLLFLVLDLSIEAGATASDPDLNIGNVLGVVFAIIAFAHYFAEALVIAGQFIVDAWEDHPLSKTFILPGIESGDLIIEWAFCICFLLVPVIVGIVAMFAQLDDWWWYASVTWFVGIMAFYVIFALHVVFYEVRAAFSFVANRDDTDSDLFLDVIQRCILLTQRRKYGGDQTMSYLARNVFTESEDTDNVERSHIYEKSKITRFSLWVWFTKNLMPEVLFTNLQEPKKIFTTNDVEDYRPFMTRTNWSLERIFCRPTRSRYITIVSGPGSLTQGQIKSSVICSILGGILIILSLTAFLVWLGAPWEMILFFVAIAAMASYTPMKNAWDMIALGKNLIKVQRKKSQSYSNYWESLFGTGKNQEDGVVNDNEEEENDPEEAPATITARPSGVEFAGKGTKPSEAVYVVSKIERVTEATDLFCWIAFALEEVLFFLWPAITLFIINVNMGLLFLSVSIVSHTRYYVNAVVAIEETGNMNLVSGETPEEKWQNKARLNDIVNKISTSDKSYKFWKGMLTSLGFVFVALMLSTGGGDSVVQSGAKPFTYMPEQYYYPPSDDPMMYPTCTFSKMQGGFGNQSTMLDYAWFANTAYRQKDNITDFDLNKWFEFSGDDVRDEQAIVDNFRARVDKDKSAVTFKLVSVPGPEPGERTAIILIRGTVNQWDALADAQLWSAAALMQWLRYVIPVGELWTYIFSDLVLWMNSLAKTSMDKIAFYRLTTQFAEELKKNPNFAYVQVTGHSLGGGLSLITGAQAKIPAVGLSAPNALISGRSFSPPVTEEDLNKYGFNIIPYQDIVPKLDDVADNYQKIRCNRPAQTAFLECHFGFQSLCEIQYTCGSGNRPVICECHAAGYPKPNVKEGFVDEFDSICGVN